LANGAVREASTLFSFGHAGAYDHEDDATYLPASVRIVDMGDADIIHTDTDGSHKGIEAGVRAALKAGALPVTIGGDHSINIPCINAFDHEADIHILQIDAHLDFVDERHGVRNGHGNPMRRAAEKHYVTGLTQLGIRNVSSTAKEGYADARAMGSDILSVRQCCAMSAETLAQRIPDKSRVYVTIDIDAFCPSIAPGTGTPSHGGFLYYDVLELLQQVAKHHDIVGIDLPAEPSGLHLSRKRLRMSAHILVDADACPVKEEIYKTAYRLNTPVTLVANAYLRLPNHPLLTMKVVSDSFDAADDWIAENATSASLVVTADILLAGRCIEAGATVLSPAGKPFNSSNIGGAIATRAKRVAQRRFQAKIARNF